MPVRVEGKQAQQTVDAVRRGFGRKVAQLSHHGQIFEAAQMPEKMRLLGHVAQALFV